MYTPSYRYIFYLWWRWMWKTDTELTCIYICDGWERA